MQSSRGPSRKFESEAETLWQQSLSPDGVVQHPVRFVSDTMSSEADWEIRTRVTPAEYFDWVKHHLAEDYAVVGQAGSSPTVTKTLSGDSYTLQFTTKPSEDATYIEVRFRVIPD